MNEEQRLVDGNLKIAIRKTENGHIVYHKFPMDLETGNKQDTHTNAFEWGREPLLKNDDYRQGVHYHLGRVIDEAAEWILKNEAYQGYDIEVIIMPKEQLKKEGIEHNKKLLQTKLRECNLSVRVLLCLKAADIETIGQLVKLKRTDLLQMRNFGKKSVIEVEDFLESLSLHLGMDPEIIDKHLNE